MQNTVAVHTEAASTLAVIAASATPLLYLDPDLVIIAASLSFCRAFGFVPGDIQGLPLGELGAGEWNVPQLTALLTATAAKIATIDAYEFDLKRSGRPDRRLVVNAHRLEYAKNEPIRILLAITDVTDARASEAFKDELLRQRATLLLEVQHRVANSLQIIASILMQSARRIQSDEARGYLKSAHDRVLSLAAMQRQLAIATNDDVELKPYLAHLCDSLAASMIQDAQQTRILVTVDDTVLKPSDSVSIGLIVTELVINSLKHAFPDNRGGTIRVEYHATGADWTLRVVDDGVGISMPPAVVQRGLGSSIVEALSRQLKATVTIADAHPGTSVTLDHHA